MIKARTQDIAYAIHEATKGKKGAELNAVLENVAKFLDKNKLLNKKEEIIKKIEILKDQEDGTIRVSLQSKNKLKKESIANILHFLKHYYKAHDAEIEETIKEDLIGGVKIQIGNDIIDMTLSNQIKQLQNHLLQN